MDMNSVEKTIPNCYLRNNQFSVRAVQLAFSVVKIAYKLDLS